MSTLPRHLQPLPAHLQRPERRALGTVSVGALPAHLQRPARRADMANGVRHVAPTIATDPKLRVQTPVPENGFTGTRRHGNRFASGDKGQAATHGHDGWRTVSALGRHGGEDRRYSQTVSNQDA